MSIVKPIVQDITSDITRGIVSSGGISLPDFTPPTVQDLGVVPAYEFEDFELALTVEPGTISTVRKLIGIQCNDAAADKAGISMQWAGNNRFRFQVITGSSVANLIYPITTYTSAVELVGKKVGTSLELWINGILKGSLTTATAAMDYATAATRQTSIGSVWANSYSSIHTGNITNVVITEL